MNKGQTERGRRKHEKRNKQTQNEIQQNHRGGVEDQIAEEVTKERTDARTLLELTLRRGTRAKKQ